jgi:hypothetical protein
VDAPWYRALVGNFDDFEETYQAVEMHIVTSDTLPLDDLSQRRTCHFYRAIGPLQLSPELTKGLDEDGIRSLNVNLHACAHMYASDRNSLFHISNLHDSSSFIKRIASISHAVIFHGQPEDLLFTTDAGGAEQRWFMQEVWSDWTGNGRALHQSRLWQWDEKTGTKELVGTTIQDGLLRLRGDPKL